MDDSYSQIWMVRGTRILTRHPRGKNGVNIERGKYGMIRPSMLQGLKSKGALTFTEMAVLVENEVAGRFEGSVLWYVEVIKLDLEARKIIERIWGTRPQKYRILRSM